MKVYVAKHHSEYEGFDILGIFLNKLDAENQIKNEYHYRKMYTDRLKDAIILEGKYNEDGFSIEEFEVK